MFRVPERVDVRETGNCEVVIDIQSAAPAGRDTRLPDHRLCMQAPRPDDDRRGEDLAVGECHAVGAHFLDAGAQVQLNTELLEVLLRILLKFLGEGAENRLGQISEVGFRVPVPLFRFVS